MKKSDQTINHYTPAGGVIESKGSYTDFMCDCREDEKQRCYACVSDVCKELACEETSLVSAVVTGLTFGLPNDYVAEITGIPMDMWFAVTARMQKDRELEPIKFFIQCDKVEYGFARLWQMAQEVAKEVPQQ